MRYGFAGYTRAAGQKRCAVGGEGVRQLCRRNAVTRVLV